MAYCGADTTGTREIADRLLPYVSDGGKARVYGFSRAMLGPAFSMGSRGVPVNPVSRQEAIEAAKAELAEADKKIVAHPKVQAVWDGVEKETGTCPAPQRKDKKHKWEKWKKGKPEHGRKCVACGAPRLRPAPLNPNSSVQLQHLFYDLLGVKPMKNKLGKVSADKEVLARIGDKHPKLKDLTDTILTTHDVAKQLGFLLGKLSDENSYLYSLNIGTAWTGRSSATKNPQGYGGNVQNIAERHRHIFEAPEGWEIFYADLKQAESLTVAYEAEDEEYIEAHKSGDTHTYVARLVWPDLPWTGDLKEDKAVAAVLPEWDQAPGHSYRFQSKRIQHGGNYGLTPRGIAMIAHIPVAPAKDAYDRYHDAFPGIRTNYHTRVRQAIRDGRPIVNPMGREMQLLGRPWDEHTFKQGYAASPQSLVSDALKTGLYRIWRDLDPHLVLVLADVHDAVLGMWRVEDRDKALREVVSRMQFPIWVRGRKMVIPVEVSAGKNWGKFNDNPEKGTLNLEGQKEIYDGSK